jgi:hypothetical protein
MANKSDRAWPLFAICPSIQVRANFQLTFDGWFTHRDAAAAVAKKWASQYPEAHVVAVVQPNRFLAAEGEQQNR